VLGPRFRVVAAHVGEEGLVESRKVPDGAGAKASGGGSDDGGGVEGPR
jgi:hypothetical protein